MKNAAAVRLPETPPFVGVIEDNLSRPHYVVQVRYRCERSVETALKQKGLTPFLPLYKIRRSWSDRIREMEVPLFPGYIFCPIDVADRLPILTIPGVVTLLGIGKQPLPVAPQELEAVRTMVYRGLEVEPCQMLRGQKVRIQAGPLKGMEGELIEVRAKKRLVISVSIINGCISAIIDEGFAMPVQ